MPSKKKIKTGDKIARPIAKESGFQSTASDYLDHALPFHAAHTCFPAGGGGKIRGAKLKKMGLKPGWPDIIVLIRASSFDAACRSFSRFIGFECKREEGGAVSKDQDTAHDAIRMAGGVVYVVRTLEEIETALIDGEGLKLRIRLKG